MANPVLIPEPFAQQGGKNIIEDVLQSSQSLGAATWSQGFPPLTSTPPAAGGIAPDRLDFNGIFNALSSHLYFLQSGGVYKFDQKYIDQVGGYPVGAILLSDDNSKTFVNKDDKNQNNPNVNMSGWEVFSGGSYTKPEADERFVTKENWLDSAPVGFTMDWESVNLPSDKWLRYNGATFDPLVYPELAALGRYANNKLPDVSDRYIRYIGNRTDKYLQYQTMEDAQQAWEGRFWANDLNTSQAPTGVASIVTSRNSGTWTGDRWTSYLFNISNVGAVRTADENRPKTIMFRTKIVKAA